MSAAPAQPSAPSFRTARAAGVPAGYRRRARAVPPGTWSPERVLQALQDWVRETGRVPRAEDWPAASHVGPDSAAGRRWVAESPRWPCLTTVRRYFGSWSAALEQAGLRRERLAPWELSLPERVETARRLTAEGVAAGEIARHLGVSATTVRKYLRAGSCPGCAGPLVSPAARRCQRCSARARSLTWTAEHLIAAQRSWSEDRAAITVALRELGARSGRRPTSSDLQPKRPGLPSYSKTVALFGSFAAALEAAGFPPRGRAWTREQVLAALQTCTIAHGRPPIYDDWRHTSDEHPGARAVAQLFGSWSAALTAAALRRSWQREEIITALSEWAAEHGRPPTSCDWQSADPTGRRPTTERVRREFGTWSAALETAGFQSRRRRWTEEQALEALRAWADRHGRPPRKLDWPHPSREHPRAATITRLFGSWEEALLAARLPISRRYRWQPEEILDAIRVWTTEHGRVPCRSDWQRGDPHGRRPSANTIDRHFASWEAALLAALTSHSTAHQPEAAVR